MLHIEAIRCATANTDREVSPMKSTYCLMYLCKGKVMTEATLLIVFTLLTMEHWLRINHHCAVKVYETFS